MDIAILVFSFLSIFIVGHVTWRDGIFGSVIKRIDFNPLGVIVFALEMIRLIRN